jgi:hypothetical protein
MNETCKADAASMASWWANTPSARFWSGFPKRSAPHNSNVPKQARTAQPVARRSGAWRTVYSAARNT